MFDVPVPDVAVSAVPALINIAKNTAQPGAEESVPSVPSADKAVSETLLPSAFQLLEPLNLASMAVSPETLFTLSLEPANTFQSPASIVSTGAVSAVVSELGTDLGQDGMVASLREPAADLSTKPSVTVRESLNQCIEADKPEDMTQMNTLLQVVRRGTVIGDINETRDPEHVVQALQEMMVGEPFNPNDIIPVRGRDKSPAIRLSQDVLLKLHTEGTEDSVSDKSSDKSTMHSEWAVITWSEQLRQALGATPLDAGDIQIMLQGLQHSEQQLDGLASWYGPYFHGRLTANGETFDQNTLTAAHKSLPFDTLLQVRNLKNNQTVVVRINDRGPYIGKRSLDLSKAAARCLGSEQTGVIPYEAVILEQPVKTAPSVN